MLAEGSIERVLDTMGAWRCVRFESGNVGVVNSQGRIKLVAGPYRVLRFAENGFLRVFNGREFFIDRMNGRLYAKMPEIIRIGAFEIANIRGYLCTRTKRFYEVRAIPAELWLWNGRALSAGSGWCCWGASAERCGSGWT